ncbi:MAG: hypothetical protein DHS20C21_04180 [Gemmatimonadota bacterium]|nr:MAG: hypothetical protein DHS20C21_04180 [Gemmatimonadota bacterium]
MHGLARGKQRSRLWLAGGIGVLVMAFTLPALANSQKSSGGKGDAPQKEGAAGDEAQAMYERGMELIQEGRFQDALERFEKAHKKRKDEPEFLNMVAYSQRKVGRLEDAFESYHRVLAMDPTFAPAREYLGEAHIQAALHQLDALREYGDRANGEYERLAAALREAAAALTAGPVDGKLPVPENKAW